MPNFTTIVSIAGKIKEVKVSNTIIEAVEIAKAVPKHFNLNLVRDDVRIMDGDNNEIFSMKQDEVDSISPFDHIAVLSQGGIITEATPFANLDEAIIYTIEKCAEFFDPETDDARIFNTAGIEVYSYNHETEEASA